MSISIYHGPKGKPLKDHTDFIYEFFFWTIETDPPEPHFTIFGRSPQSNCGHNTTKIDRSTSPQISPFPEPQE